MGALLLIFGLQWLRKALLRASGLKALHDEEAIYQAEVALLAADGERPPHDWYAFTVAFNTPAPPLTAPPNTVSPALTLTSIGTWMASCGMSS